MSTEKVNGCGCCGRGRGRSDYAGCPWKKFAGVRAACSPNDVNPKV